MTRIAQRRLTTGARNHRGLIYVLAARQLAQWEYER